jgi:hypothetical protein
VANPEHVAKLKEGVQAWNQWRGEDLRLLPDLSGANLTEAILMGADLSGADLSGAALVGAFLSGANLAGAALISADLSEASFFGAELSGADFTEAKLSSSELSEADLTGTDLTGASLIRAELARADLSQADLCEANLSGADLSGANLSEANLSRTLFVQTTVRNSRWCSVDLSEAVGVESMVHRGPSTVGIDTLVMSKGRIPDVFLRGCGVPEHIIAMQKSLAGGISPIQFYSCFISYSHRDEEFCLRLHSRMQQAGLRVWFAPEEMKGGKKLHDQIDEAIRVHDKLLVVLSEASMGSDWVVAEIRKARKRERSEKRQVLFPIRLVDFEAIRAWERIDADSGTDLACEIREYFIPDFSDWKNHDNFETAFSRLLKDLTANA